MKGDLKGDARGLEKKNHVASWGKGLSSLPPSRNPRSSEDEISGALPAAQPVCVCVSDKPPASEQKLTR